MSRPARGEWIEITAKSMMIPTGYTSRPARGEWIEICNAAIALAAVTRLAPRGASGLKSGFR